jgi:hypothetical protein
MYQQILDALKKKFTGVNDKILERMAKKLAKTTKTEDEVQTAVDGVTFQQIIDSEGDRRANEATDTAVRNYETKHNLKDGKPVAKPSDDDDDDDDEEDLDDDDDTVVEDTRGKGKGGKKGKGKRMSTTDKLLKQMLDNQQKINERLDRMDGEKTATSRKARFEELLKDAPEKVRTRYMRDYDRLNFKDDADYEQWLEDIQPEIESDINDAKADGGVTTPPRGGKQTRKEGEVDPAVTQYLDSEAANENANTFSNIVGLPTPPSAPAAK